MLVNSSRPGYRGFGFTMQPSGLTAGVTSTMSPTAGVSGAVGGQTASQIADAISATTRQLDSANGMLKSLQDEYSKKRGDWQYWHDFLKPKFAGVNSWDFRPGDWHEYGRQVMEALEVRYGPMAVWGTYGNAFPLNPPDAFKSDLLNFVAASDIWYEAEPRLTAAIDQLKPQIQSLQTQLDGLKKAQADAAAYAQQQAELAAQAKAVASADAATKQAAADVSRREAEIAAKQASIDQTVESARAAQAAADKAAYDQQLADAAAAMEAAAKKDVAAAQAELAAAEGKGKRNLYIGLGAAGAVAVLALALGRRKA